MRLQSDARVSLINQLAELCISWIIIGVHRAMHQGREERKYEAPMAERKGPRDRSLPLLNWHGAYPDARHASKTLIPAHSHFGLGTNHTTSCFSPNRTSRDFYFRYCAQAGTRRFAVHHTGTQVRILEWTTQLNIWCNICSIFFLILKYKTLSRR